MNIFEKRVAEFNNSHKSLERAYSVKLKHGEIVSDTAEENARYQSYLSFAYENIDKIGSVEDNCEEEDLNKRATIVYTEYGPLIKTFRTDMQTGHSYYSFEGIFKFNVDNEEKLLYVRLNADEGLEYDDFVSNVIVRREDGSFETCDWSGKRMQMPEADAPQAEWDVWNASRLEESQRVNITKMREYFNTELMNNQQESRSSN